jgi:hypothetical protein
MCDNLTRVSTDEKKGFIRVISRKSSDLVDRVKLQLSNPSTRAHLIGASDNVELLVRNEGVRVKLESEMINRFTIENRNGQ